ncbi:hypothetical protein Hanom_Chr01g00046681 [Helianthus anomalus]
MQFSAVDDRSIIAANFAAKALPETHGNEGVSIKSLQGLYPNNFVCFVSSYLSYVRLILLNM